MLGRQLRTRLSLIKKELLVPRQEKGKKLVEQIWPGYKAHLASYGKSQNLMIGRIKNSDILTDEGIITSNVTQGKY